MNWLFEESKPVDSCLPVAGAGKYGEGLREKSCGCHGDSSWCLYRGNGMPDSTKTTSPAPTNALTAPTTSISTVVPVPTVPVELSGSGESVQTAKLEPGDYTVQYTNSSGYLIVEPVNRDGSTGAAIVNANENSGVTTYKSDGPVTLHVYNGGQWTLKFVPLS